MPPAWQSRARNAQGNDAPMLADAKGAALRLAAAKAAALRLAAARAASMTGSVRL